MAVYAYAVRNGSDVRRGFVRNRSSQQSHYGGDPVPSAHGGTQRIFCGDIQCVLLRGQHACKFSFGYALRKQRLERGNIAAYVYDACYKRPCIFFFAVLEKENHAAFVMLDMHPKSWTDFRGCIFLCQTEKDFKQNTRQNLR